MRRSVLIVALLTSACAGDAPVTSPTPPPTRGAPVTIELSATPGVGEHGGTAAIRARVLDGLFAVVADATVRFTANTGTFDAAAVQTDSNGIASTSLTADPGTVKVTAIAGAASAPELSIAIQPVNVFVPPPVPPPPPPPPPVPIPPPPTPQPSYTVTLVAAPSSVVTGSPTTLTATVVPNFGAGPPTTWAWDCDTTIASIDAITPNAATCSYGTAATFTASVRVTGGAAAGFATTSVTVTAAPPPPPPPPPPAILVTVAPIPVAPATIATIHIGDSVDFAATVSSLSLPATAQWEWDDENDGTFDTLPTTAATPTNTRRVLMTVSGVWKAKVRVTDPVTGRTASATTQVTVLP